MADATVEERVSRLESGQAEIRSALDDHAGWLGTMATLAEETRESLRAGARAQEEIWEILRETARRQQETDRQIRETDRSVDKLGQEITELKVELGGLGNKFGGFAEGMALPSMERRVAERFGTTAFAPRIRKRIGGEEIELDALAYSNGEANVACVVEVKSHLRDDGIDQLLRALAAFPRFFPEHRGKRLLGVLAAVDASPESKARVLREGLVLATISDDVFELQVPEGFEPRAFPNPADGPPG
jgi:hypothetical protein